MIKVGTVCYLTGDHSRAGQCCTVTGPMYWGISCSASTFKNSEPHYLYPIALASGEPPAYPCTPYTWVASPHCLIPIAPPGLTERTDKREKAPA